MDKLKLQVFKPRHLAMSHHEFIAYMGTRVRAGLIDSPSALKIMALHKEVKTEMAVELRNTGHRKTEFKSRQDVLRAEINSVRAGLFYQSKNFLPNPDLAEVLEQYRIVLDKCRQRINTLCNHPDYTTLGYKASVREYNKRLIEEVKKPQDVVTNDGEHWFDYVPVNVRQAVEAAFAAAAATKGKHTRWRSPFTRTHTRKSRNNEQDNMRDLTPYQQAKIANMPKKYHALAVETREAKAKRINRAKQALLRQAKQTGESEHGQT